MPLVAETVQINGQDVEVFRITGHPVEDLVVLTNTLTETDKQRLIKAASGDLKANDNTKIGEDELTGVALALLQAVFPEINRGPFQLYGNLFQSLAKVNENAIKGDIAANLVQYVYDLKQGTTGVEPETDPEI